LSSGENLAKLGEHFVDDATLLASAGQYNHNLMLHMVKIDCSIRTGILLPQVHVILKQKKLMARKFTGVERASVGTTLTLRTHIRGAGGKKLSQGPSAQANLGFVDDPSAWIMDIGDTKELIYHLSIEVPLIIFVMILVSALVHVMSAGFAPMWSNFLLYGAQLSPLLIQLWTYLAPLLWLFLFGTTIYHGHRKPPDDNDPRARREKRVESQFRRRQSCKCFKYASIVDTQFHCSYP
jgi:hypothetical protein